MFAETSFKRIAISLAAVLVLALGVAYTYLKQQPYLEGFSLAYYKNAAQNILLAQMHRAELAMSQKTPIANANQATRSIPVLLYHGIIDDPDYYNITKGLFKDHLLELKKAGYQTIGIADLEAFVQGKKDLPEKSFMITFDDGRKDSFYGADAVLQALGYKAVMFVITGNSLKDDSRSAYYLSEWELKRMLESGRWEIQAHGEKAHNLMSINEQGDLGYFYSNKLWLEKGRLETDEEFRDRLLLDLITSKQKIEKRLHVPVLGLALPFGEFGEESLNFPGSKQILLDLTASVYSLTFQQVRGKNEFSQAYPFRNQQIVKRIEVTSDWSPEDLLWVMEQSAQKPIPYDDEIKNNNGWLEAWGALEPGENSLRLVSDPQATGASTILDGTYAWQDYAFQARIVPERGKTFSLIARYQDPEQYAVCRFGTNNRVVLEQFANGTRQELSSGIQRTFQLGQETHLGILVQGQRASCLHEGVAVTGSFLDASLSQGGIGFIAEDTATGTAAMKVEHIYVSANNELP